MRNSRACTLANNLQPASMLPDAKIEHIQKCKQNATSVLHTEEYTEMIDGMGGIPCMKRRNHSMTYGEEKTGADEASGAHNRNARSPSMPNRDCHYGGLE